jgi:hypothetical protein
MHGLDIGLVLTFSYLFARAFRASGVVPVSAGVGDPAHNQGKGDPAHNQGNGQITADCARPVERISVRTIDSVLASAPSLKDACFSVVKADIAGYEALALAGMDGIFTGKCPPCAVFMKNIEEYSIKASGDSMAAFKVLEQYNYECSNLREFDWKCVINDEIHEARCLGAL